MYRTLLLLLALVSMPCSAEFRDPTQPGYPLPTTVTGGGVAARDYELVLSAIWISSKSRRAMINGVLLKQGETAAIGPAPALSAEPVRPKNTTATGGKTTLEPAKAGTSNSEQDDIIAPLLATAIKSLAPELQGQIAKDTTGSGGFIPLKADKPAPAMPSFVPAHKDTVKVIGIQKNSVTIEQNGELKTLQLLQRPYRTRTIK